MKQTGIYAIRHIESKRDYIGSSLDIVNRFSQHRADLRRGNHCNARLQRTWSKYGQSAFQFLILEIVIDRITLLQREQHWIQNATAAFNSAPAVGRPNGWKHSPETIQKMREAHKGKIIPREIALAGTVAAALKNTGKKRDPAIVEKAIMARMASGNPSYWKGKKRPPEFAEKMRATRLANGGWKSAPLSEAHKAAISKSLRRHHGSVQADES